MKRNKKIKNRNLHRKIYLLKQLFKNVDKVVVIKVKCGKNMLLDSVIKDFIEVLKNA